MAEGFNGATGKTANLILAALFHGTAYQGPTTLYLQCHTGDPGIAGTSSVTNSGRRVAIGTMTIANGQASNNSDIVFVNSSTNNDGSAGHPAIAAGSLWDASSPGTGNFIMSGDLDGVVSAGADFTISAGQFVISLLVAA